MPERDQRGTEEGAARRGGYAEEDAEEAEWYRGFE